MRQRGNRPCRGLSSLLLCARLAATGDGRTRGRRAETSGAKGKTYQRRGYSRIPDQEAAVGRARDPHEGGHPPLVLVAATAAAVAAEASRSVGWSWKPRELIVRAPWLPFMEIGRRGRRRWWLRLLVVEARRRSGGRRGRSRGGRRRRGWSWVLVVGRRPGKAQLTGFPAVPAPARPWVAVLLMWGRGRASAWRASSFSASSFSASAFSASSFSASSGSGSSES